MPGYECWVGFCSDITLRGDTKTFLGDSLYLDVFPATLDEFVSLAWDSRFGPQMDHDGDGLLAAAFGGLDPDDTTHDSDGDGLSDAKEVRLGANPAAADSDGDGLSDYREAVLGTDPTRADTDGDGLSDKQEVDGWLFQYASGLFTLVTSDPRLRDSDGDGLDDLAEKNLGSNPRAATPNPAAIALSLSDADRVVTYGSSLVYTATLSNASQPGVPDPAANLTLSGLFAQTFPPELGGALDSTPVLLDRGSQQSRVIPFTVPAGSASRATAISSRAHGALLAAYPTPPPVNLGSFDQTSSLSLWIDDDRPTSTLATHFVPTGRTIMLGGQASDPTSAVVVVEVSIDGGAWQVAQPVGVLPRGNARYAWALPWQAPNSEGAHTIAIRATDAVGHGQAAPTTATLYVDAQAPTVTAAIPSDIVAAVRDVEQRWIIELSGTANDPGSGPAVSGVQAVQVFITPDGAGWQEAQLTPAGGNQVHWSIAYALPDLGQRYPTGLYQVQVRAVDEAGNVTPSGSYAAGAARLDSTPPSISLDVDQIPSNAPPGDVPAVDRIVRPITLSGVISETGAIQAGIVGAEISYTPDMVTDAYSNTLLLLYLEDLPGSRLFRDDSGQNRATLCTTTSCPTAGAAGRFGRALQFDGAAPGGQQVRASSVALLPGSYTLTQWFKAACSNCGISSVRTLIGGNFNTDRQLTLSGGNVCVDLFSGGSRESICSAGVNYGDNQWHMMAHVVGPGGQKLYLDGQLAASGLKTASSYVGDSSILFGEAAQATSTRFTGRLDEVKVFPAALSALQVVGLYSSWSPVAVAASGPGVLSSTWSTQAPTGLEGNFQIDLTGSDVLANRNGERITWNQWRGEIDTTSPRLALTVRYVGADSTARHRVHRLRRGP
ncbi:MAG: LamG-like jellyroll fold domain-containing protein [Anaerolineae bacterium]